MSEAARVCLMAKVESSVCDCNGPCMDADNLGCQTERGGEILNMIRFKWTNQICHFLVTYWGKE